MALWRFDKQIALPFKDRKEPSGRPLRSFVVLAVSCLLYTSPPARETILRVGAFERSFRDLESALAWIDGHQRVHVVFYVIEHDDKDDGVLLMVRPDRAEEEAAFSPRQKFTTPGDC